MDRDLLGHLPIVACVARHRGFAAAAAELGMSPSAVSHAVRSVEDRLSTPLFARTTRSVSLTEAGARFIASVEPSLTDIGQAVEGLTAERGLVTGLLRIDAPRAAFDTVLIPVLAKLARQHPQLTVEVRTGQIGVDIVAQGYDAGIRIRRFIQQDMVTTRLIRPFKAILVASKDYLDARGTPQSIADLHQHNCIGIRTTASDAIYNWELVDGRKPVTVKTVGTALVTDVTEALSLALAIIPTVAAVLAKSCVDFALSRARVDTGSASSYPRLTSTLYSDTALSGSLNTSTPH